MEESYSRLEHATNMEMPRNWNQEPVIPHQHLVTPPTGSTSQGSRNNSTCSSSHQYDVLSLLERIIKEKQIEETLIRSKLLSCNLGSLVATATIINERERHNCGATDRRQQEAYRDLVAKTIGTKSSAYRGVIKCNDERFEAFVWDNTDPGQRGRTVYIGAYSTEVDAAKAHDLVSIRIGGLKAITNFHVRCYSNDMEDMRRMSKWDYICAVRRFGKGYTDADSPFRGVYRVPTSRKWEARLGREGSPTIQLGTYYTAEDAARAYDIISIKLKGPDAITNFDSNSYETEGIMESVITQATDGSIILQKEESNKETEASPQNSSSVQNHPQPLSLPSFCHCCHNQILRPSNPRALGGITGGAANIRSENSIGNHAVQTAQFPIESATQQQPLQTPRQVSFNYGFDRNLVNNNNSQFPNHNAIVNNKNSQFPNHNAIVNNNNSQFPNLNAIVNNNNNSQFPNHNAIVNNNNNNSQFPNHNAIVNNNNNSQFANHNAIVNNNNSQFPNHNATQLQSFQTPRQVSFNNGFNQNLVNNNYNYSYNNYNNNQFLPQSSNLALPAPGPQNLELEKCVRFPDWRSGFGKKLLGGNLELEPLSNNISAFNEQPQPQVTLNGSTGSASTQLHSPALHQSHEDQNSNSCFSDSFQNPISEPNNNNSFQSQSIEGQSIESQIDLDVRDYLNRSYIEDADFTCDFDMFSAMNGGR